MSLLDRVSQRLIQFVDDLSVSDSVRDLLSDGEALLRRGELAQARAVLAQVTRSAPELIAGWLMLAQCCLAQHDAAAALAALEHGLSQKPKEARLHLLAARAHLDLGEREHALEAFRRVLDCRATDELLAEAYAGRGVTFLSLGQPEHAVRELRKARALGNAEDPHLFGRLGLAYRACGDLERARDALSRGAVALPADREVLLALCDVLNALGAPEQAELSARRLLEDRPADGAARCALARALLARRELAAARDELLRALADPACRAEAHTLLADVSDAAGDRSGAYATLVLARDALRAEHAASAAHPPRGDLAAPGAPTLAFVLRRRLELALDLDVLPTVELEDDARALVEQVPDDPVAALTQALLASASLPASPHAVANALARARAAAQAAQPSYAALLALGRVATLHGATELAEQALADALRLGRTRPGVWRALTALFSSAGDPAEPPIDFYPGLSRLRDLLATTLGMTDLSLEVTRLQELFDQPLLVAVMGEFNCGKSTFVNALVGEIIAPMGITPTTATVNILKYGEARRARIVYRDDRERWLSFDEAQDELRQLGKAGAQAVRQVELLYPAEELQRVNVVDTPGLNSLFEAHDETALEYLQRADAVIWLFSAGQAGKQTESQALELMARHRLKTVGVLNKVDQLDAAEQARALAHLRQEFAGRVEGFLPVSARKALDAKVTGDGAALETSRFSELRRFLEERLFERSRRIKRDASATRLAGIIATAADRLANQVSSFGRAEEALAVHRDALLAHLSPAALEQELAELARGHAQVVRQGTEEVLDFVRPRRWILGQHKAQPADRDFLLSLFTDGVHDVTGVSRARVATWLSQGLEEFRGRVTVDESLAHSRPALDQTISRLAALFDERLRLLEAEVYARYEALYRGVLIGGQVDQFFEEALPRLELAYEPVHTALTALGVSVDEELARPLGRWQSELSALVTRTCQGLLDQLTLAAFKRERLLAAKLTHLSSQLLRATGG